MSYVPCAFELRLDRVACICENEHSLNPFQQSLFPRKVIFIIDQTMKGLDEHE